MANVNDMPKDAAAAAEAAEKKEFDERPPSITDQKKMLYEQMRALEKLEAQNAYGARELTPKGRLMDTAELERKNPHLHYRWLNLRHETKMLQRVTEGYVRVPQEEGGRALGSEFALFALPKHKAEERTRQQEALTASRLKSVSAEMEAHAEEIARYARDVRGLKIKAEDILNTSLRR
jgi:hypothetical protein